jgi:conjugative relaxase-like TrwC/TraI family protein
MAARPFQHASTTAVLTIGKLGSSRSQLVYYEEQVAVGIEDYYAGRGEARGVWLGRGVEALGLDGEVEPDGFMALMRGRHPLDGSTLRRMGSCSTVAALDLTFSAPKSVSVLFALADDDVSAVLIAAHERAVAAALEYLEREACWTRRGHGGAQRLRGEGFIAAGYRHRMSRAGDPQLHTHVVVANMSRAEGKYTALDAHPLYEHKSAAGAVYRAVLRAEVRARLPWVGWRGTGRGLFEIDGIPEAVLRHFSQRRVEIEERASELAVAGAGGLSRERMQGIALATRRAKTYGVDGPDWREAACARAAEHGFGSAELAELIAEGRVVAADADLESVFARLSGPEGLTAMHNTFARRHALAELAGAFSQGISVAELKHVTSSYLAGSDVHELNPIGAEARYTTAELLACERAIVESADRRKTHGVGVLAADVIDLALGGHDVRLNADQSAAVRCLTSSGRGIEVVEALAGTGKTTMLGAVADCYRLAGWQVIGTAPTGRAARQLRETARIPAATMHALLHELETAGGFRFRTVLVIDEAGMAPTRITSGLLAYAERATVKVIAVGDPGQLGSVQAGGWLATLARRQPGPALRQVLRQNDPREHAALEALHDGNPNIYLTLKEAAITTHHGESEAVNTLVDQWQAAAHEHGLSGAVMITRDNQTRSQLNRAARTRLKRENALAEAGVLIGGREFATGDRVIARRNDRQIDIDNGTTGTVAAVDPVNQSVTVKSDSGAVRELDHGYVASHLEHAYALTAHGSQGATVTWAGVIGRPSEFTREWAYTALSRARERTRLHVIAEPPNQRPRSITPARANEVAGANAIRALSVAMTRSETEPLALENARRPGQQGPPPRQLEFERIAQLELRASLAHAISTPAAARRWPAPLSIERAGPRIGL